MKTLYIRNVHNTLKYFLQHNKVLVSIILIYISFVLSGISWGIPNPKHPFAYHMDEWAQSQSIRSLFRHGTSNISGASHGAVFHYFISGLYLLPFILSGVVNPFIIKNSLQHIPEQFKLFILLRINTLLFGIAAILLLSYIAKKYLKTNNNFAAAIFTFTPGWIILSNYFKYDIALIFWILCSIAIAFAYHKKPTTKRFLILSFFSALALSTKLSAIPILLTLLLSFFIFTQNITYKIVKVRLIPGLIVFFATFFVFGIPDIFISYKEYMPWLYSNIVKVPNEVSYNFQFGIPTIIYFFKDEYEILWGLGTEAAFYLVLFFYIFRLIFSVIKKKLLLDKIEIFLFISFCLFAISLIPLKFEAAGNRSLILLPYLTLLFSLFWKKIIGNIKIYQIIKLLALLWILYQIILCFAWITLRIFNDPREASSEWVIRNIPAETKIGLVGIPIFEMLPDIIVKDFYTKEYYPKAHTRYKYQAITENNSFYPHYVILTSYREENKYLKESVKKNIGNKLLSKGYRQIAIFSPNESIFSHFAKHMYIMSGIIAMPSSITIFFK